MPERSTGPMMFIGETCALEECHREDFLPFKCSDCRLHFCSNHFRPQAHRCRSYKDDVTDYRVPLCPICDTPPAGWKRDEDPNIAMDRHLSGQCLKLDANGYLMSGRSAAKGSYQAQQPVKRVKKPNECTFVKCSKIMVVPIQCPQCRASFCPSHRAPAQHSCSTTPKPGPANQRTIAGQTLPIFNARSSDSRVSGASSAIKGAFKNMSISSADGTSSSKSATSAAPTSISTSISKASVASASSSAPFGKVFDKSNKRARAERISAIKAMQARQKKGILSKEDEIKLAEEMAAMARFGKPKSGDSDCIVA
ncbi:hypothetical protein BCV70DRAFT_169106 [Testicularia cyperi]|uniref:AN1-type domain-containing protein n=1 Tax=Testicularia cyperi TaxID=1882483 RepID=A0A317XY79_9BASI|nr:hypothetical protein BCV70DRAFT_169106 [Testicularia cyperi]